MKLIVFAVSIGIHITLFIFFTFTFSESSSGVTLTQGENETELSQTYIKFSKSQPINTSEPAEEIDTNNIPQPSKPLADVLGMQEQVNDIALQDSDESEKQEAADFSEPKPTPKPAPKPAPKPVAEHEEVAETEQLAPQSHTQEINEVLTVSDEAISELESEQSDVLPKQVKVQGDNAAHSSIGSQGQIDSVWLRYQEGVFEAINAQKTYPKQARLRRLEGVVVVEFEVDVQGNINRFNLVSKAKSKHLNRSTRKLFSELKLPKPSLELAGNFPSVMTIPIEYSLN